jgi:hypothetical protein
MKMPHLGRLRFKTTHAFLKVAVSSRQSLVLSQVLRPRFDDERFDVVRGMLFDPAKFTETSVSSDAHNLGAAYRIVAPAR